MREQDQNTAVPDYLKGGNVNMGDVDSAASSSLSVPRISLKGKVFRLVENGEEVKKIKDEMKVVILGVEPEAGANIKTFYAKGYSPTSNEPPTCASDDGISPSPWILPQNKQSNHCATCPKNVFGSATSPNGKATKACRDSKRIWVVDADAPEKLEKRVVYGLNVTVSSLRAFSEYGRHLKAMGAPMHAAITKMVMEDSEFPQLNFELAGWIDQSEFLITNERNQTRPWRMHVSSGLALAAPEGGKETRQLPGMPPPDYLKQGNAAATDAAAADKEAGVIEGQARVVPDSGEKKGNSEDILNNW